MRLDALPTSVFVHSLALVESETIGEETRIWAFSHIMSGARVGARCNIGEHVFIESGAQIGNNVTVKNGISVWDKVVIEDDVFLGPHMIFTNDRTPRAFRKKGRAAWESTIIRHGCSVGAGAVLLCGIELGPFCLVAAGSVVTRSVPPSALVAGNPARLKGYVCDCLETRVLKDDAQPQTCPTCGVTVSGSGTVTRNPESTVTVEDR